MFVFPPKTFCGASSRINYKISSTSTKAFKYFDNIMVAHVILVLPSRFFMYLRITSSLKNENNSLIISLSIDPVMSLCFVSTFYGFFFQLCVHPENKNIPAK